MPIADRLGFKPPAAAVIAAAAVFASACESPSAQDSSAESRRPSDAGLAAENFPSALGDNSTCVDYMAASSHDRLNFLRARKNLTRAEARSVDEFVRALCEAAVETGGGDGGNVAESLEAALRASQNSQP